MAEARRNSSCHGSVHPCVPPHWTNSVARRPCCEQNGENRTAFFLVGAVRVPQENTMRSRSISLMQWSGTSVNTHNGDSGCRVQQATWLMAQRSFPLFYHFYRCVSVIGRQQQVAKRGAGEVHFRYCSSGIRSSSMRPALTRYLCCLTILAGQFTIPT